MGNSGHGIIILIRLVYWNNYRDICMHFYFLSANFMHLSKIFCVIPSLSHTRTKYWRRITADLIDPFVLDAVFNLPSSYTLSILRIMRSVPPQWHFNCLTAGWSLLSKYMWTSTVLTAEPILSGLSLSVNYFISNSGPPILCFCAKYVASILRPHTRTCKIVTVGDQCLNGSIDPFSVTIFSRLWPLRSFESSNKRRLSESDVIHKSSSCASVVRLSVLCISNQDQFKDTTV